MGITVDISDLSVSIPKTKMSDIISTCDAISTRDSITKKDLQSLLGKLLYISRIIRPARAFLNRMLQWLRTTDGNQRIAVSGGFRKDLDWFRAFARSFNGCSIFRNSGAEIHEAVFVDASLHGLGAVKDEQFYSTALPPYILKENRIVVFEMINILVSLNVWGRKWANT